MKLTYLLPALLLGLAAAAPSYAQNDFPSKPIMLVVPFPPGVPTIAEQGVKGFDVSVFFGIVAPAATPPKVVAKLNSAFAAALQKPELARMLAEQGLEMAASTDPENLRSFMTSETAKWQAVVKSSGAQLD